MELEAGITWRLIEKMLLVCQLRAGSIQQRNVHSWKSPPRTLQTLSLLFLATKCRFAKCQGQNEWIIALMHRLHWSYGILMHPYPSRRSRRFLVVAWTFFNFYFYFPLSDVIRLAETSHTKEHFHTRMLLICCFSLSKHPVLFFYATKLSCWKHKIS